MSEFESVYESDGEAGLRSGVRSEGKFKWAVYRLNEELYLRLLAKRQRGEKINFKERGGDHQFTSANRKPTPARLSDECGSGFFIIEHLFGGVADDWSFVRIDPSVAQVGAREQVSASAPNGAGPTPQDRALELALERLEELEHHRARGSRRHDHPRRIVRTRSSSDSGAAQQVALVLELQRESREQERAMWQQLLESARAQAQPSNREPGAVDNPYALFAPLAANNPTLAEKLMDRAFPEEEKTTWMGDILKHPQEAMQLVQAGVSLLARPASGPPPAGAPAAATEVDAMNLIVVTLIDDVAKNRRVGRVADLIEEQCRKFPALAPHVVQTLRSDNATIFHELQKNTGVDLSTYAHAGDFLSELREELENTDSGDNDADASSLGDPPSDVSTASADASPSRKGNSGSPSAQAAVAGG